MTVVMQLVFNNIGIQLFFRLPLDAKPAFLKFLQFVKRFPKAPFPLRISVDGRSNRRNKAAFS